MGVLNVEIVGGLVIIYVLSRLDNIYKFSHQLVKGVQFYLPPGDDDIARIQPAAHKRMKKAPRQKSLPEKLELLNLQLIPLQNGLLINQPFWDVYDFMFFSVIISVLNHFWSKFYVCLVPEATSLEWPFFVTLFSLVLCVHTAIYATSVVGFQVPEGRNSIVVGVVVYLITSLMFYRSTEELALMVGRLSEFMRYFVDEPVDITRVATAAVVAIVSLVVAALVAGMVIPAWRYSRLHLELWSLSDSWLETLRLAVDVLLPLIAGLAWFAGPSLPIPQLAIHSVQVLFTILFVCSRVSLFRDHLQRFLFAAKSTLLEELVKSEVNGREVQDRLRIRFKYICIAASEYLAFPFAVVCLLLLLHLKGSLCFGVCSFARGVVGWSAPPALVGTFVSEVVPKSFMAIITDHQDQATTTAALQALFKAINKAKLLSPQWVSEIISKSLAVTLLSWFVIYSTCLLHRQYEVNALSKWYNQAGAVKTVKAD